MNEHLKRILREFGGFGFDNIPERLSQSYLLANDAHLTGNFINNINKVLRSDTIVSDKSLAILIGNSYIHSLLPDMPAHDVLVCDIDYRVHNFIFYLSNLMMEANQHSDSFEEKEQFILDMLLSGENNPYYYDGFAEDFQRERGKLGKLHFLSSGERFSECVRSLNEKKILPININLLNNEQANKLSEILYRNGCTISFLNLTNVRNYDLKRVFAKNLDLFPIQKDAKLIWSFIPGKTVSYSLSKNKLIDSYLADSISEFDEMYKKIAFEYARPSFSYFRSQSISAPVSVSEKDIISRFNM